MTTISLRRPDDWHLHLRDGAHMAAVLPFTAARFARALVMPNLKPPMTTTQGLSEYRARILAALPAGSRFEPLLTLYLTDRAPPEVISRARARGFVVGAKLYPAGATTRTRYRVLAVRQVDTRADTGAVTVTASAVTLTAVEVTPRDRKSVV